MYLYNTNGVLTKYDSPLQILSEFFEFRYNIYTKRKAHHLKFLNNELEILRNKVRYIDEISKDKITIVKKRKDEIIDQLMKRGYPKLSKKIDATDEEKSYGYLSDMLIWHLTVEKKEELEKELADKEKEYNDYDAMTEIGLWERELNDFKKEYEKWITDKEEREDDDSGSKNKKKKKKKEEPVNDSNDKNKKKKKKQEDYDEND
jgi:DNA topoisomerase-2